MSLENVTVLFTDMVGSTALSSTVSAEDADELRRAHFAVLRQALAEAGGTEVKNLGDGLMVVFGAASAALSCAVTMQQGVERNNRDRERAVGLRVGLSGGEVSREEGDYFGDPVVEAARLCARCDSGQILASDLVRLTAGRRSRHLCKPVGALELKGLPEPVDAVELQWEPLGGGGSAGSTPLQGRLAMRPGAGVVGRATELATMLGAYKRVTTGGPREVVLVSGEAGLGKTTLVAEVSRATHDDGAIVLIGHCEEGLATPYQLFAEALGHYVTHADEDTLLAHVATYGPELSRMVPQLVSRIPDLPASKATDADTERYLLLAAAVGLLADMSRDQPVVLVLDDLQWADKASLQLLRHLITGDRPMRLLILGTYRDDELSNSHPFVETLAVLHRQTGVARVELAGLDDSGVVALMEAAAGHTLDDTAVALAHALYRETDGNPFFVTEVLRHLAETGRIYQDESGRWVADGSLEDTVLPESIRVVVGARVGRLGRDAERMLAVAAVMGRDFDLIVLARATEIPEDDVLDLLDAAMSAALVRELAETPGRYNFAHALIQRTLYEDLGPTRRARDHRQVAEALEDLCGDDPGERIGELAYHWANATQLQDGARAVTYAHRAGDRALAQLAPDEAQRWYRDALDLLDRVGDDRFRRAALLLGLGDAQRQTGDPDHRETLLAAARLADEVDATDVLVRAALRNSRGFVSTMGVVDHERVEVLTQALKRLGAADSPDRAKLLALVCSERLYETDFEDRLEAATEAVDMARRTGDHAAVVYTMRLADDAVSMPHTLELRRRWAAEATELAGVVGDPMLRLWASVSRFLAAFGAGDAADMRAAFAVYESEAERIDQPFHRWQCEAMRVMLQLLAGDLDAAEQTATEAVTLGIESGVPDALMFYGVELVTLRYGQGRISEILPLVEQTAQENPAISAFRSVIIWAKSWLDPDDKQVRLLLDAEVAAGFPMYPDIAWLASNTAVSVAAANARHQPAAAFLYERLLPWKDQFVLSGASPTGAVAHFLGLLAHTLDRYDEADRWFAQALALHQHMEGPTFVSWTMTAWAALLLDRNQPSDVERARELVETALPIATEGGYFYVERDARAVLGRISSSDQHREEAD